jgi:hypothetical protein
MIDNKLQFGRGHTIRKPVRSVVLLTVVFYYFQRAGNIRKKTRRRLDFLSQGKASFLLLPGNDTIIGGFP